ncbi:DNA repair protein RecO [Lichenihabitans sp. PAMC28606]|uniref:DNA repair protein RecO n=1 Tax=Lichenihabitans sp. PAMC28606 TaxID=2880932 RepID=UPI001D0AEE67|nr:DNA repair protein RecO [Lichenihabitans sp. PAMC28606]UDL95402.1 DNA repair protein RecO [Lichenihabitans sp. PAMC28606]
MEWRDDGIVVGIRRHGETSVILDLVTRQHGRHLGFVHGGRSRRLRPSLQPGNGVEAVWRSRVEHDLGTYTIEPRRMRASRAMETARGLHALNHLCGLARLLPEREPHPRLHDRLEMILEAVDDRAVTPLAIVFFELDLLTELGFGLDLSVCVATGRNDDLAFVSPKSGRAVSRSAGEPYADRMLVLPAFLIDETAEVSPGDLVAAFRLAEYFLMRDVFVPRGLAMQTARHAYLKSLDATDEGGAA